MPDWRALGERAIRFARPPVPARAIVREVRAWPGVIDVVVARADVAAYFDGPPAVDPDRLRALASATDDERPAREHALRVVYDGIDLPAIAGELGLSVDELARIHGGATYVVETMGFAPGFAYLAGLDPRLVMPRRATPRPRVSAGSVAIAGAHTAIYPFDSPGGWHLVGHVVGVRLFDAHGALLRLGDRVRFVR